VKIAFFDAFAGAAGDMFLGALVDAGWPAAELEAELGKLPLDNYAMRVEKVTRGPIAATHVHFEIGAEHHHRNLAVITGIIEASSLEPAVRDRAIAMFRELAAAEARAHGSTIDEVHFHEVGAVDSILDIVGAAAGLEWLDAGQIVVAPMNTGGGTIRTQHGEIPVPGMATLNVLEAANAPVFSSTDRGELLTPTGALVLTHAATGYGRLPAMQVTASGYGAGSRDPELPNVLRLVIGETESRPDADVVAVIETNLDDVSPEVVAYALERLLAAGALDAYATPIQMKKGRPATMVSAIARPDDADHLAAVLFAETSTLGVRIHETRRRKLARDSLIVTTNWGDVRVKLSFLDGRRHDAAPEYDDCARLAREHGVPLRSIMDDARARALSQTSDR
jgi:pyridinium-3,5-bisthiocarboxylic acid mononucleotide nickel chelatase